MYEYESVLFAFEQAQLGHSFHVCSLNGNGNNNVASKFKVISWLVHGDFSAGSCEPHSAAGGLGPLLLKNWHCRSG